MEGYGGYGMEGMEGLEEGGVRGLETG